MDFRDAIQNYTGQPLNKQILLDLLKEYKRPYDKINELVKQELIIQVKRGMYIPGPKLKIDKPEPFLLANHILAPSYISLDTALSYWRLIPERVYEISSVTTLNTKTYKTKVGRFSYAHIPLPYYSFGIKQIELTKQQTTLIATPEKALCDKIVTTKGIILRSKKQVIELLTENLRIDKLALWNLDVAEMNSWLKDAPKKTSLIMLVKALKYL